MLVHGGPGPEKRAQVTNGAFGTAPPTDPLWSICLESRWLARQQCRRLGELPSLPLVYVRVGAGDGIRTRDILLGRIMSAPLNLFQAPKAVFGRSWPSVSKTLGPLSPKQGSRELCQWKAGCWRAAALPLSYAGPLESVAGQQWQIKSE